MIESHETFQLTQAAKRYKIWIAAAGLLIAVMAIGWGFDKYQSWQSIKVYEKARIDAERDAQAALTVAADIAAENVKVKKQLAEKEIERGGKAAEVKNAEIKVYNDRLELNRVRRERRGDNPSPEQLCGELEALGIRCER